MAGIIVPHITLIGPVLKSAFVYEDYVIFCQLTNKMLLLLLLSDDVVDTGACMTLLHSVISFISNCPDYQSRGGEGGREVK